MTEPDRDPAQDWPISGADWPTERPSIDREAHPFAAPESNRYQLGGQLGRGGMGVVHAALDARLGRTVALKRAVTAEAAAQLAREATLTAGLDHPGIVQVHDAGIGDDGAPYYTMRVAGARTLADALAETADLAGRLRLLRRFLVACEAVAYAHDRGVVHRDLKPANILLGAFGETQVADWGLACARLDERVAGAGTIGYLPPEHADAKTPGPATDVYALGVTLAELIAGRPLAAELARDRRSLNAALAGLVELPPDLLAIVARATDPDLAWRYPDAKALAADLEAFLDGRRVAAHRYTAWQLARRVAVAWRAPLLVAGVALLVLAVAQGIAFVRTLAERDRAVAAESDTRAALQRADHNLGMALLQAAHAAAAAGQWPQAELLAARAAQLRPDPAATGVSMRARAQTAQRVGPTVPLPQGCVRTLPDAAGKTLLCLRADSVALYDQPTQGVPTLRWQSPGAALDGATTTAGVLVSRGPRQLVHLAAADGHARVLTNPPVGRGAWLPGAGDAVAVRFAVDGFAVFDAATDLAWAATTCAGQGTVAVARAPSSGPSPGAVAAVCDSGWVEILTREGTPTRFDSGLRATEGAASTAWWQPDGRGLLVGSHGGDFAAFDWPGGARRFRVDGGGGQMLRIAGTAQRAVTVGDQGGAVVWDLATGARLARLPSSAGRTLAYTADGEILLYGATMSRWRVPDTARALTLPAGDQAHGLASAAVAPDGERVALVRGDGTLLVVRLRDGAVEFRDQPAAHVLKFAAWSRDGGRLAVAAPTAPGLVVYATAGSWPRLPTPTLGGLRRVVQLHSGALVAAPYGAGLLVLSPGSQAAPLPYLPTVTDGIAQAFRDVSVSLDHRWGVAVDGAGGIHRVEDGDPVVLRPLSSVPGAEVADIAVGGAVIAVCSEGRVTLLSGEGASLRSVATGGDRIHDIAFSADVRWLVVGELSGKARVLEVATLRLWAVLAGHERRVSAVAFDPQLRWLLTASWDGSALLWDLPTLTTAPAELVGQAERRWGLDLQQALGW